MKKLKYIQLILALSSGRIFLMAERKRVIRKVSPEEEFLTRESQMSATPSDIAHSFLGLPENVRGMTIVDLASGASSLTAELLANGADAHAVDVLYGRPEMQKRIIDYLDRRLLTQPQDYRQQIRESENKALQNFLQSFQAQRNRYHGAYLTKLPFPDGFSDWTVSLLGISDLARYEPVMIAATFEALRVTKSGGKVVIAPLHPGNRYYYWYSEEHEALIEELRKRNVGDVIVEKGILPSSRIPLEPMNRLTVLKK